MKKDSKTKRETAFLRFILEFFLLKHFRKNYLVMGKVIQPDQINGDSWIEKHGVSGLTHYLNNWITDLSVPLFLIKKLKFGYGDEISIPVATFVASDAL